MSTHGTKKPVARRYYHDYIDFFFFQMKAFCFIKSPPWHASVLCLLCALSLYIDTAATAVLGLTLPGLSDCCRAVGIEAMTALYRIQQTLTPSQHTHM